MSCTHDNSAICQIVCCLQEYSSQAIIPFTAKGHFFLLCIESLVDSNYGAVDLVNSTVIALCTKLPARMLSRDHSCQWLPFTADGHFSVSLEWYQSKPGSHEDSSYVNSSSAVNVTRLLGNVSKTSG